MPFAAVKQRFHHALISIKGRILANDQTFFQTLSYIGQGIFVLEKGGARIPGNYERVEVYCCVGASCGYFICIHGFSPAGRCRAIPEPSSISAGSYRPTTIHSTTYEMSPYMLTSNITCLNYEDVENKNDLTFWSVLKCKWNLLLYVWKCLRIQFLHKQIFISCFTCTCLLQQMEINRKMNVIIEWMSNQRKKQQSNK